MDLLPIVGIELGFFSVLGLVARFVWVKFTDRVERDENEIQELRKEIKQCLGRESKCQQQIARMEAKMEGMTRELERLRGIVEQRA